MIGNGTLTRACAGMGLAMALAAAGLAHGAIYLGPGLQTVKAEDRVKIADPRPVQVIVAFQTKGAPNARATKYVKAKVLQAVTDSGLFSSVAETPAADGAILSVTINDVAAPKDMAKAEGQGAVTGATLFLAGSNVVESYEARLDYIAGPDAPKISQSENQFLVFQMGLINKAPKEGVKVEGGLKEGVFTIVDQVVSNGLNALAKDPSFLPAAAAPAAAPAATPVSTPASSTPNESPAVPAAPPPGAAAAVPPVPATTPAPAEPH